MSFFPEDQYVIMSCKNKVGKWRYWSAVKENGYWKGCWGDDPKKACLYLEPVDLFLWGTGAAMISTNIRNRELHNELMKYSRNSL